MNATVDLSRVILETERLILRPFEERDLEDFYAYASVPGVGEMAGWSAHRGREESAEILKTFMENKRTFALVLKASGRVVGSLGLEEQSHDLGAEFERLSGRELGYVLSKKYWGKGLIPEAVAHVIRFCFEDLDCDFLCCGHFDRNFRSRRVVEKSGFQFYEDVDFKTQMGTQERGKLYVLRRVNATIPVR